MNSKILFYLQEMEQIEKRGWAIPVTCEMDPSNRCQNQCAFCISKNRTAYDDMDLAFALAMIKDLHYLGVKSITFTGGGEPTMNPGLPNMIEFAALIGMKIGLITNGIEIGDIPFQLLEFVRISLDAGYADTYKKIKHNDAYEQVIDNITNIRPSCKTLGLSYVMCGQGEVDMARAEKLAEELAVDYIQFKPEISQSNQVFYPSADISFFTKRYDRNRDVSCDIAGLVGIITADGRYVYCCQHRYETEYTIADLRENSLAVAIISRDNMDIDNTQCKLCRYSNYAEEYTRYRGQHHAYMLHKEFL